MTDIDGDRNQPTDPFFDVLQEAFARHQGELLGTCYFLLGGLDAARDALQETFARCWQRREEVPRIGNLRAWIFGIALGVGRDFRRAAPPSRAAEEARRAASETAAPTVEPLVDRGARVQRLREAIRRLPVEEQEAFLLRQNGDMTDEEIAAAVGAAENDVKARLRLALHRLREALRE